MITTFKNEWGSYGNVILKAFQHEPIEAGRMEDKRSTIEIEIEKPKLSVCLSGTPNQVNELIKGTENGLFSRILFYNFRNEGRPSFKNVFRRTGVINLTEYFDSVSNLVMELRSKVLELPKISIKLTESQEERHQQFFDKMLGKVFDLFGDESTGTVIRLGLIQFRFAMLLTVIRKFEKGELAEEMECEDIDFETSLKLSEIYLEHALSVFQTLPGTVNINLTAKIFIEFLPKQFTYNEAVMIGEKIIGRSEKTVSNYLKELKKVGWLNQPKKNGDYFNVYMQ